MDLPKYYVYIYANNYKYDVTGAVTHLELSEKDKQLAQSVTVKLANIQHKGAYLTSRFDVINLVVVVAEYKGKKDEVFRGYLWTKDYTSDTDKVITLPCYDNLIYLQKSEIYEYFSSGAKTKTICEKIFNNWGIPLEYSYSSIIHSKMPLEGSISNLLINDILDPVKKQTSVRYVIRSERGNVKIMPAGMNTEIPKIVTKKNVGSVRYVKTMDDVITKVVITGTIETEKSKDKDKDEDKDKETDKETNNKVETNSGNDESDRKLILGTVMGDVNKYGTLQKVITKNSDTELSKTRAEASGIIKENGKPKETIYLNDVVDNPFLRKGDRVQVTAGNIVDKYCIVTDITHNGAKKVMNLVCELCPEKSATAENAVQKVVVGETQSGTGSTEAGRELNLSNAPLYRSSDAKSAVRTISGTYYLYDGINRLDRYRITNTKSKVEKKPINSNVTGWIDKEDIK